MKISYQGERLAFTINLSFIPRLKPGNKALRQWKKEEEQRKYYFEKHSTSPLNKYPYTSRLDERSVFNSTD